jgi:hypothetical protein
MGDTPLDSLTYQSFVPHLGEAFAVQFGPGRTVLLALNAATELPPASPRSPQGERFSLIFYGPRSPYLQQGTYAFSHSVLGSFPLFIVPIGTDEDHLHYQAVFNRLKQPEAPTA